MKLKFKQLLFGAAMGLVFAAQSAAADTLDTIQQRKKILIAIDVGNPPHGMMDAAFKPVGSDVETAKLLAKDMGVELEIVQVTAPNRVQYLLSKKADIVVSALSITDERKKVIDYSTPYAELQSIVAAPSSMDIKSYADLSGKSVAVTRGTVNDQELTRGVANVPNVKVVRFDDDPTSTAAISSGQLQIYASSMPLITQLKKTDPKVDLQTKFVMKSFPLAIALRKQDPRLQEWLNNWVKANLANGKLAEIYKRYHGVDIDPAKLAAFPG